MNILDYQAEKYDGDVTAAIFAKMKKLLYYYKEFEVSIKDLDFPVDIDTFEGQQAMKDFLEIRVVEELMEMREAIIGNDRIEHVYEEVADSLNFLISSYILYGWNETKFKSVTKLYDEHEVSYIIDRLNETKFKSVTKLYDEQRKVNSVDVNFGPLFKKEIDKLILEIVYQIGITCNKLKIRPWKKSQYLTDMLVFEERFELVYYKFFDLIFKGLKLSPEELWSIFSRKNQCNRFRIDTGY